MFAINGLDHVALQVTDITASEAWYGRVLGFERVHAEVWGDSPAVLVAANGTGLALFPQKQSQPAGGECTCGYRHVAFGATRDAFEAACRHLERLDIPYEFQDHTVSHSIYFTDPDGHLVELTTYEMA